jgi:hypothetical protein
MERGGRRKWVTYLCRPRAFLYVTRFATTPHCGPCHEASHRSLASGARSDNVVPGVLTVADGQYSLEDILN